MKEDYCSFEISKLLKEKGFDWNCHQYDFEDWEKRHSTITSIRPYNFNEDDKCISIPTHQMAMKWLREERWKYIEISFSVTLNGEPQYNFGVLNRSARWVYRHKQLFSNYEEAVEAAIKYCLTKLI